MAIIDRVGDWHSRTTGRYVEKPWTLGHRLFGMFGKNPMPPKVAELVSYSNTIEQQMTPDATEADVVAMGEKLGTTLDAALPEINSANLDGDVDKVIEDYETAVFYMTTPRIWPVAPEGEEAPKASSAGYRKVGSERSKTRGVERVKNYTDEEKQALGIYDLSPENRAEFRRLRKDYLSDTIRRSSVRASVFLEEVGALIQAVGADTPLGKELAKWQMVMRRRVGIHDTEEYAAESEAFAGAKVNTQAFQAVLADLGDTTGVQQAANLGASGDREGLRQMLDAKVTQLEKSIKAVETFVSSFDKFDNFLDKSWMDKPKDPAAIAAGKKDTRSASEKSAAATKSAETRKANGQDQWRAPDGTPQGGQFIDMPYAAISKVGNTAGGEQIKGLLTAGKIPEAQKEAEAYLKKMDSALNSLNSVSFSAKVSTMTASGGTVTKTKWEGPLGFEGKFTGDNRYIMPLGLDWSNVTFPQPFRWASEDIGAHDGARVIGTIQGIKRMEDGTIWGWGTFDMKSELGKDAQRHVEEELTAGVSLDLDRISAEVADSAQLSAEIGNLADAVQDMNITVIRGARTRSATLVALPAFEGARIKCVAEWSHARQASEDAKLAVKARIEAKRKKQILESWQAKFGSVPTKVQVKEEKVKELAMALSLEKPEPAAKTITIRIPKKA